MLSCAWLDYRDAHNLMLRISGYPTEKNSSLLRRIIEASNNPGDIVLDGFCGSGTALTIADQFDRAWIGVDNSPEALRTILHRFEHGTQPMGDFGGTQTPKCKKVAPSLFPEELPEASAPPPHQVETFELSAEPRLRAWALKIALSDRPLAAAE